MWTSQERHGWGVVRPYLFLKQVPRSHSPCALSHAQKRSLSSLQTLPRTKSVSCPDSPV